MLQNLLSIVGVLRRGHDDRYCTVLYTVQYCIEPEFHKTEEREASGHEVKKNGYSRILRSRLSEDLRTHGRELETEHQKT
jgi:hypothetical protein